MHFVFIGEWSSYNKNMNHWALTDKADQFKQEQEDVEYELDDIEGCSHLDLTDAINFKNLKEFKETLPAYLKTIFELHYEYNMSIRDIARDLEEMSGHQIGRWTLDQMKKELNTKIEAWKSSLV